MQFIFSPIRELVFRIIRRVLLIIEWLLAKLIKTISARLPFWKVKPVARIFNVVDFPHQAVSGTLSRGVWVNGRVLSRRKSMEPPKANDSSWKNFRRVVSLWLTREVPKIDVTIRIGATEHQVRSDENGYFELTAHDVSGSVHIKLDESSDEIEAQPIGTCNIPEYVIVSDIDDTILETGTDSMAKMLKTTLLSNSLTRELVSGMPEILNGIHADSKHPVFYVTSSPWNLYDFLGRVFKRAQLPEGGMFMTNWGLPPKQWLKPSHQKHKGDALKKINTWYPDSKFLLFGDDSQNDYRIYAGFIRMYPDKVHSAFIRHTGTKNNCKKIQKFINKLHEEIGREVMFVIQEPDEIKSILAR